MKRAASAGHSTATDLADWLVLNLGLPFREAHHVTGKIVALAESKGLDLKKLPLSDLKSVEKRISRGRVFGARCRRIGQKPDKLWRVPPLPTSNGRPGGG